MTSINSNIAALRALVNLGRTNDALQETQDRISTGLKIRSSRDDPSGFAIAERIRSQIRTFDTVSEALTLAQATYSTGAAAVKAVDQLVEEIKDNIIQAQGDNVDRRAIQQDIDQLVEQIQSQVETAEFNGTNLINGGTDPFTVLIGIKNPGIGAAPDFLSFDRADLNPEILVTNNTASNNFPAGFDPNDASQTQGVYNFANPSYTAGDVSAFTIRLVEETGANPVEHSVSVTPTTTPLTLANLAIDIKAAIDDLGPPFEDVAVGTSSSGLIFDNGGTPNLSQVQFKAAFATFDGGPLAGLSSIDVSRPNGSEDALLVIDKLVDVVRDATLEIGSRQQRIDLQQDFISSLLDSLELGVSALVDADLTEESVRLNQEQAKQQLGFQSLAIAGQAPQSLLQLFQN